MLPTVTGERTATAAICPRARGPTTTQRGQPRGSGKLADSTPTESHRFGVAQAPASWLGVRLSTAMASATCLRLRFSSAGVLSVLNSLQAATRGRPFDHAEPPFSAPPHLWVTKPFRGGNLFSIVKSELEDTERAVIDGVRTHPIERIPAS